MKSHPSRLQAAIQGILAGGVAIAFAATPSASASDQKIKCYNTCTGKGACKTSTHACKGQNGCEGDGKVVMLSREECLKGGGLIKKPRTPAYPMPPAPQKTGT